MSALQNREERAKNETRSLLKNPQWLPQEYLRDNSDLKNAHGLILGGGGKFAYLFLLQKLNDLSTELAILLSLAMMIMRISTQEILKLLNVHMK